jgi:CheY-like chemotaxis protein
MEAIGTLAGGIAHDFNNLLMGVQGNVSLMIMDRDVTDPDYKHLRTIENQIRSGGRLASRLLGFARKGKYEVKPVDLNRLALETCETFGRTRKDITIHQDFSDDLGFPEADSGQMEQVLLNLFVNAGDAMPRGGNLSVKTVNTTHMAVSGGYRPQPGDYVLLSVTDTGVGMDEKTITRIFDPFFTTKGMGRGTGLGLASAYGIIKAHGGYIDVESKEGQGSTFSIYLPSSEKEVERTEEKTVEQFMKGREGVLLVDDEDEVLEASQKCLERMGYGVLMAKDGKEALQIYKKHQDFIDIIVLDMVMPTMGGGEAYDSMKEINKDVKVLLASGYSIDGEAGEILERGCNGFIQKPFNFEELSAKIREILDKEQDVLKVAASGN